MHKQLSMLGIIACLACVNRLSMQPIAWYEDPAVSYYRFVANRHGSYLVNLSRPIRR